MTPAELAALHARCFETPPPWSEAAFAALLSDRHVFLATAPDGFLLGRAVADEAELLTLAVSPDRRRQGSGRSLLHVFDKEAASRGAKTAFLEVSAENRAAIALYEGTGWVSAGRRPNYYRHPDGVRLDALILSKALCTE